MIGIRDILKFELLPSVSVTSYVSSWRTQTVAVDCKAGYGLLAIGASATDVEARFLGDSTWTNIKSMPLDVSAFNNQQKQVEIRYRATSAVDEFFAIRLARI